MQEGEDMYRLGHHMWGILDQIKYETNSFMDASNNDDFKYLNEITGDKKKLHSKRTYL